MQDIARTLGSDWVTAVLSGGPADLPESLRTQQVSPTQNKIKLLYQGGYEHYERPYGEPPAENTAPIRFHWTMRTRIAE